MLAEVAAVDLLLSQCFPLSWSEATGEGCRVCFWLVTTAEARESLSCLTQLLAPPMETAELGDRTHQTGGVICYSMKLLVGCLGTRKCPSEEGSKGNSIELALTSLLGLWLPFVLAQLLTSFNIQRWVCPSIRNLKSSWFYNCLHVIHQMNSG